MISISGAFVLMFASFCFGAATALLYVASIRVEDCKPISDGEDNPTWEK